MINYFTFGAIGSLISAISIGVIFYAYIAYSLFPPNLISSGRVVAILFGVGILLASFGYRAIKNKYGLLSGKVGFGLGIITSVLIFSNTMVGVFTQDIMFYEIPTFSNYIDFLFSLPLLLFFGLTLVIWGIAHFKSRKFYKKLNVITSGFFIVSGGSILSVFYRDFWLIFSVASLLFASIVFLISSFGINHKNKSDEYLLK